LVKGEKHRAKDEKKVIGYRDQGSPVKFATLLFCEKFNWAGRDQGKQVKSEKKDGCQLSVIGYQGSEVTG
jgi:hypothetical protein